MRSSEMKKFLLSIAAILGVVIALLLANDALCKAMIFSSTGTPQYKMWRLFEGYPKGEIAILGSSRAQSGIVPSIIGDNVFNYGLDGSTQYETVLHLHAVVARRDTAPIIVNLDPWGIHGNELRGDYSLVTKRAHIPTAEQKLPVVNWDAYSGARFFGQLRPIVSKWLNSKISGTKAIAEGAIITKDSLNDNEWKTVMQKFDSPAFEVNAEVMKDFDAILTKPHAPIIFVISPVTRFWYEKFASDESNVSGLTKLIARLGAYQNTVVIDLMTTNVEKYSNAEFFDPTHLNEHGARRFSEELAECICGNSTNSPLISD